MNLFEFDRGVAEGLVHSTVCPVPSPMAKEEARAARHQAGFSGENLVVPLFWHPSGDSFRPPQRQLKFSSQSKLIPKQSPGFRKFWVCPNDRPNGETKTIEEHVGTQHFAGRFVFAVGPLMRHQHCQQNHIHDAFVCQRQQRLLG